MAAVPAIGVPTAPQVFFQPLSSHLAYPGFSKQCGQCEQQDNWCHKQDQQYTYKIHLLTQLSFHHGLTEVVNLVASGLEI